MCGIIGFNFKDETLGKRMTDAIALRGPDDSGVFVGPAATVGSRRLAIIDLSDAGHQPMQSEDKAVALVYNGEVYNYKAIRESLRKKGHRFKSNSDTEVVLRAYEEYGEKVADMLEGMWAFAFYDIRANRLVLSCDFFGIKPLFYYHDGGVFVFASEVKAIRLFLEEKGVKLRFSREALEAYFSFGYTFDPLTVFESIRKVSPGETLVFDLAARTLFSRRTVWKREEGVSNPADFERVLLQSVERHLAADVPVGIFLSGGADSTLLALLLKKLGRRLHAYTVRMGKRGDADYAQEIARFAGLSQEEVLFTADDLDEMYARAWELLDEPIADTSIFPSLFVAKRAARDVKVVITGEGSDEMFTGYERYQFLPRFGRALLPLSAVSVLERWLKRPESVFYLRFGKPLLRRLRIAAARVRGDLLGSYEEYVSIGADFGNREAVTRSLEKRYQNDSLFSSTFFDEKLYLPNDLLYKTDFATMAYSLEGRVPYLDRQVYEFARGLPQDACLRRGTGKFIIKEYLAKNLPAEFIFRRKEGFSVPNDLGLFLRHERDVRNAVAFALEMRVPLSTNALVRLSRDASYFRFVRDKFPVFLFSLLAFHKVVQKYPLMS